MTSERLEADQLVDEFRKWELTHNRENYGRCDAFHAGYKLAKAEVDRLKQALDKIRDPRKRHKEPDLYTELGCIMNIADKALEGKK